jgi:hypothetical protein
VDEWPPPEARVRAALWEAESHLERREYFAAAQALSRVFGLAGDDESLLRGLHHLAAAGYKAQSGDERRARRQLDVACRRLAPYPDAAPFIELVERELAS